VFVGSQSNIGLHTALYERTLAERTRCTQRWGYAPFAYSATLAQRERARVLGRRLMSAPDKKHFDAAGEMLEVFAARLGQNGTLHSETVIAAAARMAGTMLFRSFGFDTSKMLPGAAVLSNEANQKGPELLNIVGGMLQKYGLQPDKEKLSRVNDRGEPPLEFPSANVSWPQAIAVNSAHRLLGLDRADICYGSRNLLRLSYGSPIKHQKSLNLRFTFHILLFPSPFHASRNLSR